MWPIELSKTHKKLKIGVKVNELYILEYTIERIRHIFFCEIERVGYFCGCGRKSVVLNGPRKVANVRITRYHIYFYRSVSTTNVN